MDNTSPETGTYAIVNVHLPQWVADTRDSAVVVHPYIGSQSQQWNFDTTDGVFWNIRNVASGRYLGLRIDENVRHGLTLWEVDHRFAWRLRPHQGRQRQFMAYIPNISFVIDLNPQDVQPGTALYLWEEHHGDCQAWHLCKDLHLETSRVLQNGRMYKIINFQSNTAIAIKDDHTVACFQSDSREQEMFQAVETAGGWGFRNPRTERYLGLTHNIVYPDDHSCLSSIAIEFTWMVLPHYEGGGKFQIWLPFTHKALDLHLGQREDNTPIHITGANSVDHIWW
ncbi:hypothetical protein BKA70DRAFT_1578121, partial [Coprinopsis sp. MPI-PUGE-AT-0042]